MGSTKILPFFLAEKISSTCKKGFARPKIVPHHRPKRKQFSAPPIVNQIGADSGIVMICVHLVCVHFMGGFFFLPRRHTQVVFSRLFEGLGLRSINRSADPLSKQCNILNFYYLQSTSFCFHRNRKTLEGCWRGRTRKKKCCTDCIIRTCSKRDGRIKDGKRLGCYQD